MVKRACSKYFENLMRSLKVAKENKKVNPLNFKNHHISTLISKSFN